MENTIQLAGITANKLLHLSFLANTPCISIYTAKNSKITMLLRLDHISKSSFIIWTAYKKLALRICGATETDLSKVLFYLINELYAEKASLERSSATSCQQKRREIL